MKAWVSAAVLAAALETQAQAQVSNAQYERDRAAVESAQARCDIAVLKTMVAYTKCMHAASHDFLRRDILYKYPDLADYQDTMELAIAADFDAGRIGKAEFSHRRGEVTDFVYREMVRRNAAARPTRCFGQFTGGGSFTVDCY